MYKNLNLYKNKILAISLIAIFAMSIGMAFAPTASAQIGISQPRTTAAYIAVAPTVIGVGQQATVNAWVLPLPMDYAGITTATTFYQLSVTFTKPDGTKDTFTPTDGVGIYVPGQTDSLGTLYFYYAPNMAGNWSVTVSMPAQNYTDKTGTIQWAGSTSQPAYFTVTTEQQNAGILNGYPYAPLPTGFWTYPINSNNREWSSIASNWGGLYTTSGNWQPYGSAPSTGHILWKTQTYYGGIVSGDIGTNSYEPSSIGSYAFSSSSAAATIIDGMVVVAQTGLCLNGPNINKFSAYSLTTGKLLYTANGVISKAINLPGNTYAQSSTTSSTNALGAEVDLSSSYGNSPVPSLWGSVAGANGPGGEPTSVWNYYDPLTGTLTRSITNVTATTPIFSDNSALCYGITYLQIQPNGNFAQNYAWDWNLTKVVNNDWYTGIMWRTNITNGANQRGPGSGSGRPGVAMSADYSTVVDYAGPGDNLAEGFSATDGKSIWNLTLPYEPANGKCLYNTNYWMTYDPTFSTYYCYSDLTGALVWSAPNVGIYPWNTKTAFTCCNDANNVYVVAPDGTMIALSLTDGKVLWQSAIIPTTESTSNVLGDWSTPIEAGGCIYEYMGYSVGYEINPIPRFSVLECINATTGATVFTLNGGLMQTAEANGYLMAVGIFDGLTYCLGKGPTSTAVTIPNSLTEGVRAQIQGNVLDQSPAQLGTPAVSDSSMSEQMDYLHMQNATLLNSPPNERGVMVTLTAVDPNNNTVTIGTTTTDSNGNFYLDWAPAMTGDYKITATFAGSGSYWPSHAETGVVVNSAPTSTSGTSTTATTSSSGISATTFYIAVAAIIIVMVIIAIVLVLLMLRKRP